MLHQLHPWHSPWASPLTQQVRTSSLPGPPVHRAMGSRVQRRSHACAESSTFQPPFGGGPCRSLQAEPCQRRREPSVKLFKAHSCPCGGRRSSSRHLGSQGQEQTPKLPPSLGDVWKKRLCGGPGGGCVFADQCHRHRPSLQQLHPTWPSARTAWRRPVLTRWSLVLRGRSPDWASRGRSLGPSCGPS